MPNPTKSRLVYDHEFLQQQPIREGRKGQSTRKPQPRPTDDAFYRRTWKRRSRNMRPQILQAKAKERKPDVPLTAKIPSFITSTLRSWNPKTRDFLGPCVF